MAPRAASVRSRELGKLAERALSGREYDFGTQIPSQYLLGDSVIEKLWLLFEDEYRGYGVSVSVASV